MLTQARIKELFLYFPFDGVFVHKTNAGIRRDKGNIAGNINTQGYVAIGIDGHSYLAHRLTFLYVRGYFPEHEVDHRDGIRHRNVWE